MTRLPHMAPDYQCSNPACTILHRRQQWTIVTKAWVVLRSVCLFNCASHHLKLSGDAPRTYHSSSIFTDDKLHKLQFTVFFCFFLFFGWISKVWSCEIEPIMGQAFNYLYKDSKCKRKNTKNPKTCNKHSGFSTCACNKQRQLSTNAKQTTKQANNHN